MATETNDGTNNDNHGVATTATLAGLSEQMALAVASAKASIVRVDDGARLTATGTVWAEDETGFLIVATSHGTERDDKLFVVTENGTRLAATLVGRDGDTDLALLRVADKAAGTAAGLAAIKRADADGVAVGQLALALAQPGDMGLVATLGIVSARRDSETDGRPEYILHTDATLFPGASGGALINVRGEIIGLLNRMYGRGMAVAVGTPLIARVADHLAKHGKMARGYLGVRTQLVSLPDGLRVALGLAQERGLLVVQVADNSPAHHAGLMLGDTVVAVAGAAVEDVDDLRARLRIGEPVAVRIIRGGQTTELTATATAAG